jgi:hypothetical protein
MEQLFIFLLVPPAYRFLCTLKIAVGRFCEYPINIKMPEKEV